MNANTHPIELLIVLTLEMIEGLCWIINELAGFHERQATYAETGDVIDLTWQEVQARAQYKSELIAEFSQYTVKQLQELVGTRNSRYRKADLIQIAINY